MGNSNIQRDAGLSSLANIAYSDNPPKTIGNWTWLKNSAPNTSGFFAVAYKDNTTNQIVITYRGTDKLTGGDVGADVAFGAGSWNPQFQQAAEFTAQIQRTNPTSTLLTTGHSLGGGIAQIMGKMFGVDGASFDAPGALAVTNTADFATAQAQFASGSTGQIGATFLNYTAQGSVISSVGTHIGGEQSLVNLTGGSTTGAATLFLGMASLLSGGAAGVIAGALGITASTITSTHPMSGIQSAMFIAAGLDQALKTGDLQMKQVPWSQANNTPWVGAGAEPSVIAFVDKSNQVKVTIQQQGNSWTASTPDQAIVVSLTPNADKTLPPLCTVQEAGKDTYSCTLTQNAGQVTISKDTNGDKKADQIATDTLNANGSETIDNKNLNADGTVKNEVQKNTSLAGDVSATISGQGAVVNLTGAAITLADGASATLIGSGNTVKLGNNNTLTDKGTNETIDVTGNGSSITADNANIKLENGASATLAGKSDTVTYVAANDSIQLANADNVNVAANGNTLTAFSGMMQVSINGTNDTVAVGDTGNTINVKGNNNQVSVTGKNNSAYVDGNTNKTVESGNSDSTFVSGSNNLTTSSGHANSTITFGDNNTTTSTGANGNTQAVGSSNTTISAGTDDTTCSYGDNNTTSSTGANDKTYSSGNNNRTTSANDSDATYSFGDNNTTTSTGANNATYSNGNNNTTISAGTDDTTCSFGDNNTTSSTGANNATYSNGNNNTAISTGTNSATYSSGNNDTAISAGIDDTTFSFGNNVIAKTYYADGNKIYDRKDLSSTGVMLDETITATSADKKTTTVQIDGNADGVFEKTTVTLDANLDGKADKTTMTVLNADKSSSVDTVNYTAAGLKADETITATSADKKTTTVQIDGNADGVFEKTTVTLDANLDGKADKTTMTVLNADKSSSVDTVNYTAAGLKADETLITTSADSKTITTQKDIDGDGVFDKITVTPIGCTTGHYEQVQTGTQKVQTGTQQVQTGTQQVQTGTQQVLIGTQEVIVGYDEYGPFYGEVPIYTSEPIYTIEPVYTTEPIYTEVPVYTQQWVVDPVILNLQGLSVQTQGVFDSIAQFDMQNAGQKNQTGWATAGEGMLFYDPYHTNTIQSESDLVGGFAALNALDVNHDSKLDAGDGTWQDLKVWVDPTGTGTFQSNQLFSLDQLGIASIDLHVQHLNQDNHGNTLLDTSTFTWANGTQGQIAGVDLASLPNGGHSSTGPTPVAATSLHQLISAMAAFAPPAAATTSWASGTTQNGQTLLAVTH